jgi:hypothetical protein
MTPERSAQRIQVAGEPRPSAQTAVPQQPPSTVWPVTARRKGSCYPQYRAIVCVIGLRGE